MKFSLEIGPKTELSTLPALKDVYITMLPGGDYKETAQQAINLVKKGFNPIPHFPARSIENEAQLKEYVSMCKDGGVKQALVIGGSREPVGSFAHHLFERSYPWPWALGAVDNGRAPSPTIETKAKEGRGHHQRCLRRPGRGHKHKVAESRGAAGVAGTAPIS